MLTNVNSGIKKFYRAKEDSLIPQTLFEERK